MFCITSLCVTFANLVVVTIMNKMRGLCSVHRIHRDMDKREERKKRSNNTHTHTHINDILMSCTNLAITYSKKRRLNRATGDKIDDNEKIGNIES